MKRLIILSLLLTALCACRREPIYDLYSNYTLSYNVSNRYFIALASGKKVWWNDPSFRNIGWARVESFDDSTAIVIANDKLTYKAQRKHLFDVAINHVKLQAWYANESHMATRSYQPNMSAIQKAPGQYYLYGFGPEQYNLIAYTDLTTSTQVVYDTRYSLISAETPKMSGSTGEAVYAAPSHIYVASKQVHLPYVVDSTYYNVHLELESPVEEWTVIIHGIKNLSYNTGIQFVLTNQYKEFMMSTMKPEGEALILFAGTVTRDFVDINTTFHTFGFVPGKKYIIQGTINDGAGYVHRQSFDITNLVINNNGDHILEFSWDLTLDTLTAGGLEPSTNEWQEEREDRVIS